MENKQSVCAVVVTFNRKELLKECLQALLHQTRPLDEIIVIDNASSDGTDQMVRSEFPQVTYVRLPENIGGAGGFHEGMKLAYEKGHDWIWVMDDDAIPARNCLEKLLVAINDLGNKSIHSVLWSQIVTDRNDTSFSDKVILEPVTHAMFVGFAISRELMRKVGFPRKDLFIYCDDSEYCLRIRKMGGEIFKVLGSVIYHKDWDHQEKIIVRVLNKILATPNIPKWKFYYLSRNNILINSYSYKAKLKAIVRCAKLWVKVALTQPQSLIMLTLGIVHGVLGISGKKVNPEKWSNQSMK